MVRCAFSVSSVPEPLSTDMRSCWKAANPGPDSRGAALDVRAASAIRPFHRLWQWRQGVKVVEFSLVLWVEKN